MPSFAMSKFVGAWLTILIVFAMFLLAGCAGRAHVAIELLNSPPCDTASGVLWAGPKAPGDRTRLSEWCRSVGPVVVQARSVSPIDVATSGLIVVTWNQHGDYGDLERLLRSLIGRSAVVALVQEVARASESVPLDVPPTVRVPGRIGPKRQVQRDIAAIARDLNLSLAYLPSMPNGSRTQEDRGCAILSTLAISDVMGIELPWVSQRRVAVMATVSATKNAMPWQLRVVNVHLDNRWQRSRQAAAIADFLDRQESSELPTVIGGDMNAWYGVEDAAVREINRVVPRIRECGDQVTFRYLFLGLRLDHLFTTLPQETRAGCFVSPDRFGSDHHPIVLSLVFDSV
jgi:endonuclease/exonuclease/phosphatase family metal-dependent hydrolase